MNANSTSPGRVEPGRSWSLRRTVLRGTMLPPNRSRPVAPVRRERSSRPGGREINPAGDARRSMLRSWRHMPGASERHRRPPVSDGGTRDKVATTGMRVYSRVHPRPPAIHAPLVMAGGRAASGHRPPAGSRWASGPVPVRGRRQRSMGLDSGMCSYLRRSRPECSMGRRLGGPEPGGPGNVPPVPRAGPDQGRRS